MGITENISQHPTFVLGLIIAMAVAILVLMTGWGVTSSMAKSKYDDSLTYRYSGSTGANSAMSNPSSNYTGGNSLLVLQGNDDGGSAAGYTSCSARRKSKPSEKKSTLNDSALADIAQGHA